MDLQKIYNSCPFIVQNMICTLYGMKINMQRYQKKYAYLYDKIKDGQHWPDEKIERYQNEKFVEIVQHAYHHNPYYRRKYDSYGVDIKNIKDLRDIIKLPTMTKKDMREVFKTGRNDLPHVKINTSGSTGTPLSFRTDYEALNIYYALWKRYKLRFNITNRSRKIVFGGKMVVPITQTKPPFWRYNMSSNQFYFSTQHLSEKNLASVIEQIIKIKPEEIFSYPSALNVVARYVDRIKVPSLRIITLTCENVLDHQRENIERTFGCKVSQTYGLAEPVIFYDECEKRMLHHNFEFGFCELVDEQKKAAQRGEIVVTGYYNKIMPFIRYHTSDIGVMGSGKCGCGRNTEYLKSVDGRIEDCIYTPDGNSVGRMSHIFKGEKLDVVESQFIQNNLNKIDILVVKGENYTDECENIILTNLRERLGNKMHYKFIYVNRVPRTSSGKIRAVVSNI